MSMDIRGDTRISLFLPALLLAAPVRAAELGEALGAKRDSQGGAEKLEDAVLMVTDLVSGSLGLFESFFGFAGLCLIAFAIWLFWQVAAKRNQKVTLWQPFACLFVGALLLGGVSRFNSQTADTLLGKDRTSAEGLQYYRSKEGSYGRVREGARQCMENGGDACKIY